MDDADRITQALPGIMREVLPPAPGSIDAALAEALMATTGTIVYLRDGGATREEDLWPLMALARLLAEWLETDEEIAWWHQLAMLISGAESGHEVREAIRRGILRAVTYRDN